MTYESNLQAQSLLVKLLIRHTMSCALGVNQK